MKKIFYFSVFAALLLSFVLFQESPAVNAQRGETVFRLVTQPKPMAEGARSSPASVREAVITFNGRIAESAGREVLRIPLFDGKIYEAGVTSVERRSATDSTWRGKIKQGDDHDVILTFRGDHVSGLIFSHDAVYEIIPRGDEHILIELDQRLFPECGGEVIDEMASTDAVAPSPESSIDSGDRIDVLVVYTTATKNFLGGDAQVQTFAQSAVDSTNSTYINSKVRQRIRLVHAAEYEFVETGNSSNDLTTLRANATVQALRNTHNADLVAMLGEVSDVCGIAYLVGTPGGQASGYSLTARSCAIGNLTFAHELGHNMASHHNPENAGSALYPYSYGHWIDGQYRTVMSYINPCTNGCVRRPYWSNPNVRFNNIPTGVENLRDNVRSLNNTANNVANYRYSGKSITLTRFTGAEIIPRRVGRTVTWTSANVTGNVRIEITRDEGTTWQTLVGSAPNTGSAVVNVGGTPSKKVRLRVVS
ncbi:MAG: hypothetical protein H0V76_06770, partial [Blastocatellia bacterium]|nr:hypothetical protein [Blastocatellia bacterium]